MRKKDKRPRKDPLPWRTDLPLPVRVMIRDIALGINEMGIYLQAVKDIELETQLPACSAEEWLALYEDPSRMWTMLLAEDWELGPEDRSGLQEMLYSIRDFMADPAGVLGIDRITQEQFTQMLAECGQEIDDLLRVFKSLFMSLIEQQNEELVREFEEGACRFDIKNFKRVDTPESIFLFRVYLPCCILFGELPHRLIAKARGGDVDAFCQLLSVDPTVTSDPDLGRIEQAMRCESPGQFKRTLGKYQNESYHGLNIERLHATVAAFMVVCWDRFRSVFKPKRLGPKDMQKLFQEIEGRRNVSSITEKSGIFEHSDQTWRQAVNRQNKHFESILPDLKRDKIRS